MDVKAYGLFMNSFTIISHFGVMIVMNLLDWWTQLVSGSLLCDYSPSIEEHVQENQ